jgi:hypothetical protein
MQNRSLACCACFSLMLIGALKTAAAADKVGVFRPGDGYWYLDMNGDGSWNGTPTDKIVYYFGSSGDKAMGMKRGGKSRITVVNPSVFDWYTDTTGGGASDFNWASGDEYYSGFGTSYAFYVSGIWPSTSATFGNRFAGYVNVSSGYDPKLVWYLDLNNNFVWDGYGTDTTAIYGGWFDTPVVQNTVWGGAAATIGYFKPNGDWKFDTNHNLVEDAGDTAYSFGTYGDVPVMGDWTGWNHDCIGVFRAGTWYIDYNCNGTWDSGDRIYYFGQSGDIPVVGDW